MKQSPSSEQVAILAEGLRVLGHATRLRLLLTLREKGECPVGQIEAACGVGQPALSQQLAILRRAGLVQTRREAKLVHYRLNREVFARLARFLSRFAEIEAGPAQGNAPAANPASQSAAMFARIVKE